MSVIIYPQKLKIGDTIATTAVSATANLDKIDLAINSFKNLGLNVVETENVRREEGLVSSNGKERAIELLELYKNPNVKYIIASRGGEFLMEMLPYLNEGKEIIRNNPKWIQGFSDPSLLNLYITTTNIILQTKDRGERHAARGNIPDERTTQKINLTMSEANDLTAKRSYNASGHTAKRSTTK